MEREQDDVKDASFVVAWRCWNSGYLISTNTVHDDYIQCRAAAPGAS